jgi:hypothetical protein
VGLVDDFWEPWEKGIASFDDVSEVITSIFKRWVQQGHVFAWRGVANASCPLHSSLYRRVLLTSATANAPKEDDLQRFEAEILKRAHQWGLQHFTPSR